MYTSIKLLREALRVQVKVKFTVSLAAPVLHLEIRRHKARGGGALSDPLLIASAAREVIQGVGLVHTPLSILWPAR